jgi:hypothetical protein
MAEADLGLVLRHLQSIQDDMRVLTAMVLRVDHGQARMSEDIRLLGNELRAMHQQYSRFNDRLVKLEGA